MNGDDRPGGNYTQPWISDDTHRVDQHRVYVRWKLVGTYGSDVEAADALRKACEPLGRIVEIG